MSDYELVNLIYILAFSVIGLTAAIGLVLAAALRIRYDDPLEYIDDENL